MQEEDAATEAVAEERDLSRDFDDPEPTNKVTPAVVVTGGPSATNARSSRVNANAAAAAAQLADIGNGKSILFDLDEDVEGTAGADGVDGAAMDTHGAFVCVRRPHRLLSQ